MKIMHRPLLATALLFLLATGAAEGQQGGTGDSNEEAFLRAVGAHFDTSQREILVLSQWRLPAGEIPVVLRLASRAGVSPDVVVAQRRRGGNWMEIARGYSVHAGDFHVPIDGPTGFLSGAYERFDAKPASEWREVALSDEEVVGLVNVRFLSRSLGLPPGRVLSALGEGGDIVAVFQRLKGGGGGVGTASGRGR